MIPFIDLAAQQDRLRTEIKAGISQVLAHGQYILGPEVDFLEERLAAYCGAKYCISCANGTDALQIALMALGVGPGDTEGEATCESTAECVSSGVIFGGMSCRTLESASSGVASFTAMRGARASKAFANVGFVVRCGVFEFRNLRTAPAGPPGLGRFTKPFV